MKHVYVILLHKDLKQLKRLVNRLDYKETYFVIHVCKNFERFSEVKEAFLNRDNVFFCKRERATWATYYIAKAEFNGIETALNKIGKFDYLTILSAQDYPLKRNEYIRDFLINNKGKEFMSYNSVNPELNSEGLYFHPIKYLWTSRNLTSRYENYHTKIYKNNFIRIPGENEPGRGIRIKVKNKVKNLLRKVIKKREFVGGHAPYLGSNWFTITYDCCKFVIDNYRYDKTYHNFMKYVYSASEMFFQTIVLNSPYKNMLVNDNLHYIRFNPDKINPDILINKDFNILFEAGSTKLFARKFDIEKSTSLLDKIDSTLLKVSEK